MKTLQTLSLLLLVFVGTSHAASNHKIKVSMVEQERVTEYRVAYQLMSAGKVTGRLICDDHMPEGYNQDDAFAVAFLTLASGEEQQINFLKAGECHEIIDIIFAKLVDGDVVVTFDAEHILDIQN